MSLVRPIPELCSALDPAAQPALERLHQRMAQFYNSDVMRAYLETAETVNETWGPELRPQWHLRGLLEPGTRLLDLGCGSAHVCRHWADRGLAYTGVDWSRAQVEKNRATYPGASFESSSLYDVALRDRPFDAVMTLYVVEHLVWPQRLLDQMLRLTRPGGLMAIMTPPFRVGEYMKSFRYGLRAMPIKDKLRTGRWIDALVHLYQHRVAYPRYLRAHFPQGAAHSRFLIHLNPVCLDGVPFFPDSDAVYLSDTFEMRDYLAARGATDHTHWPQLGYLLMTRT